MCTSRLRKVTKNLPRHVAVEKKDFWNCILQSCKYTIHIIQIVNETHFKYDWYNPYAIVLSCNARNWNLAPSCNYRRANFPFQKKVQQEMSIVQKVRLVESGMDKCKWISIHFFDCKISLNWNWLCVLFFMLRARKKSALKRVFHLCVAILCFYFLIESCELL